MSSTVGKSYLVEVQSFTGGVPGWTNACDDAKVHEALLLYGFEEVRHSGVVLYRATSLFSHDAYAVRVAICFVLNRTMRFQLIETEETHHGE